MAFIFLTASRLILSLAFMLAMPPASNSEALLERASSMRSMMVSNLSDILTMAGISSATRALEIGASTIALMARTTSSLAA